MCTALVQAHVKLWHNFATTTWRPHVQSDDVAAMSEVRALNLCAEFTRQDREAKRADAALHRAFVARRCAQSLLAEVVMGTVVDVDVCACGSIPHKEMVRQGQSCL